MTKFEWNDSYLLNITEIDNQHKKLLSIANELYEIFIGSEEAYKLNMSKVLKKLTDYTVYHFEAEEKFMASYGYTGTAMHKSAHDMFISEVNQQIQKLNIGTKDNGQQFYSYILNWILTHIAKADKVWADFVKTKIN